MNGNSFVIDSNIVIYHLNGDTTIERLLEGKTIFLSFITEIEVKSYKKLTKSELAIINQFLGYCQIIHSNEAITEVTISLRREFRLKTHDALILATAKHLNLPLLTADKRLAISDEVKVVQYGSGA